MLNTELLNAPQGNHAVYTVACFLVTEGKELEEKGEERMKQTPENATNGSLLGPTGVSGEEPLEDATGGDALPAAGGRGSVTEGAPEMSKRCN